ncbi:MAG: hypothetical protein ABSF23_00825 [Terracidiphilus sp.]|jgi:hypothetical protein
MGRESLCTCEWNGETAQVKALLESAELILRGEFRRKIPFAQIKSVRVEGGRLRFKVGGDAVAVDLGQALAEKWKKSILTPLPTLAKKLGITPESTVWVVGAVDDAALAAAIDEARALAQKGADVILARVNTPAELVRALKTTAKETNAGAALWIVYRKGPGHPIGEADVRSAGLATGIVDVKVVGVSAQLTALKFVRRAKRKSK